MIRHQAPGGLKKPLSPSRDNFSGADSVSGNKWHALPAVHAKTLATTKNGSQQPARAQTTGKTRMRLVRPISTETLVQGHLVTDPSRHLAAAVLDVTMSAKQIMTAPAPCDSLSVVPGCFQVNEPIWSAAQGFVGSVLQERDSQSVTFHSSVARYNLASFSRRCPHRLEGARRRSRRLRPRSRYSTRWSRSRLRVNTGMAARPSETSTSRSSWLGGNVL